MSNEKNIGSTQPIKKEATKTRQIKTEKAAASQTRAKRLPKKDSEKTERIEVKDAASCAGKTTIRKKTSQQTKKVVVDAKKEEAPQKEVPPQPVVIEKKRVARKKYGNSSFSAIVKTVSYIGIVLVISAVLAFTIILAANDVFAFSKSDNPVSVTVPEMPDISTIAEVLADADVIRYPSLFKLYARFKEMDAYNFASGEFTVSPNMNYDALIYTFVPEKAPREQVVITIPEGFSVDEIIDLFVSKGIGTREGFIDVINNHEFDYWFLKDLQYDDDRIYRLEGYLYPDTYEFYIGESPASVIERFLKNFENKWSDAYSAKAKELGYTIDEVITIASILEKEAFDAEQMPVIASVLYNRLESSSFPFINCDSTAKYIENFKDSLEAQGKYADYMKVYDTYQKTGLPIGPICCPGADAVYAALHPENTDYYYFLHDGEGKIYLARTADEHQNNLQYLD